MMPLILLAALLMAISGVPGLALGRRGGAGEKAFATLMTTGALLGLGGVVAGWFGVQPEQVSLPWSVPGGLLLMRFDTLSGLFMFPVLVVAGAGSIYGLGYRPQRGHPINGRRFRLFFGLSAGSLLLLLGARNSLLFLAAWEIMALAGFFLVSTDHHRQEARRAGFLYLVATHTGTLTLFGMFAVLGAGQAVLAFPAAGSLPAGEAATLVFCLALLGFGLKAGLMPLHVWLPAAHAAAPSHASALLSGVMIKAGIYGLVRVVSFYAAVPPWWGWVLLGLGAVSGVAGVALALAQHDLKRLLAYHSVENIGIIAMGLGLALLGRSTGSQSLVVLGLGGALLHVVNHGLFKPLLFLAAGSVVHGAGTREIDRCGGLLKRQPWTAGYFLIGAVAICGLPPLNGFVSELLLYRASFTSGLGSGPQTALILLAAPVLALIGGLALACFVKVFGVVFLGAPRSEQAGQARPATRGMRAAMAPLAFLCGWIGLLPFTVAPLLAQAAGEWAPELAGNGEAGRWLHPLVWLSVAGGLLGLLLAASSWWLIRRSRRAVREVPTWGCGFARPAPRAQYTASSFADGLVSQFDPGQRLEQGVVAGHFPRPAALASHLPDPVLDRLILPVWNVLSRVLVRLRALLQNGLTTSYLLYVALTLFVLLSLLGRN